MDRSIAVDAIADSCGTFRIQQRQPEPGAPESQIKIKPKLNNLLNQIVGQVIDLSFSNI